jgi:iron(III) transport system ATP-binding protein
MTTIRIAKIAKNYGAVRAVDHVDLTIHSGEMFFLLGPSGCGKTTLLRMLAGFITPDEGELFFDDQRMNDVPPRLRNTGMVFQNYALWPHRTVAGNVAYGLEVRGLSRADIKRRVDAALKLVRLSGLGERRVTQLSGGQQQRVALARALVIQPRVLLLDEPLSNLDARLRLEMREEIRRIHCETGLTMVYVTHDQKEALSLADCIAVMQTGRLAQVGRPMEVYARPVSRFVADFLGDSNFIAGVAEQIESDGRCRVATALGTLAGVGGTQGIAAGSKVICSIRPEAMQMDATDRRDNAIKATVERVTFLGEVQSTYVRAGEQHHLQVLGLQRGTDAVKTGAEVTLTVAPEQVIVMME